ncbi:transposase [Actinomyces oricola]|uniref:transposase n=1 Tax=Actinomyces oricola TaxID=206043 RepID=UPI0013E8C5F1
MDTSLPAFAVMLREAEPAPTAFAVFLIEHWKKIWWNSPIERVNTEISRPIRAHPADSVYVAR